MGHSDKDTSTETSSPYRYDPGLGTTASCKSAITYLDGDNGVLRYRGYPIEQLADNTTYLDVAFLILNGELPNAEQSETFAATVRQAGIETLNGPISGLPEALAHLRPMAFLHAATAALAPIDTAGTVDAYVKAAPHLIGSLPLLVAAHAAARHGHAPYEATGDSYTAQFLNARFGVTDHVSTSALDLLLVLHADHEQNCSTTTCRTAASAHADPYHALGAAIGSLAGPLHGGANEEVLVQLETIYASGSVENALQTAKRGEHRLMGFGHRVYKNFDPRATIIRSAAHNLFAHLGTKDPLLDVAVALETAALADDYFVERKLYPNVDFYSGLIYRALGFETSEFTTLFAIGRCCGWLAHGIEQLSDPEQRIIRPRQVYIGGEQRTVRTQ